MTLLGIVGARSVAEQCSDSGTPKSPLVKKIPDLTKNTVTP